MVRLGLSSEEFFWLCTLMGTDGKGAGAGDGDGEVLLRGYDGGKGAGALEDQGAVGGGSEFEGAFGSAVKGDYTILIAGDGARCLQS